MRGLGDDAPQPRSPALHVPHPASLGGWHFKPDAWRASLDSLPGRPHTPERSHIHASAASSLSAVASLACSWEEAAALEACPPSAAGVGGGDARHGARAIALHPDAPAVGDCDPHEAAPLAAPAEPLSQAAAAAAPHEPPAEGAQASPFVSWILDSEEKEPVPVPRSVRPVPQQLPTPLPHQQQPQQPLQPQQPQPELLEQPVQRQQHAGQRAPDASLQPLLPSADVTVLTRRVSELRVALGTAQR